VGDLYRRPAHVEKRWQGAVPNILTAVAQIVDPRGISEDTGEGRNNEQCSEVVEGVPLSAPGLELV